MRIDRRVSPNQTAPWIVHKLRNGAGQRRRRVRLTCYCGRSAGVKDGHSCTPAPQVRGTDRPHSPMFQAGHAGFDSRHPLQRQGQPGRWDQGRLPPADEQARHVGIISAVPSTPSRRSRPASPALRIRQPERRQMTLRGPSNTARRQCITSADPGPPID